MIKKASSLLLLISMTALPSFATSASFMEGQFEEVMYIPQVNSIEAWEQPRTQYTPKNLVSEYQMRYSGSDTNGRNSYSYTAHFTDYDTYITGNGITEDGKYYVQQNNGKSYVTGEKAPDLTPINDKIEEVNNNVTNVKQDIKNINNNITQVGGRVTSVNNRVDGLSQNFNSLNSQFNNIKNQIDTNSNRINKVESRLESGLATVSALTALHPNPRSNEKLEVAVGAGMYADNVAGAIGLFYHPNDRVMLSVGASYGGEDQFAGNFGITFGLGRRNK